MVADGVTTDSSGTRQVQVRDPWPPGSGTQSTMSEQQLAFSKVRAVELDRYAIVASNVGISALVTPDGRELGRTKFFQPEYLDNQVRRKTTLTPAAQWGPILQGTLVATAIAVSGLSRNRR